MLNSGVSIDYSLLPKDFTLRDLKKLTTGIQGCLDIRGPVGIGTSRLGILANIDSSYYDDVAHRIVLTTDIETVDDGQKIVIDIYVSDLLERIKSNKHSWKKRWKSHIRKSDSVNHIPVRISIRIIQEILH